MTSEKELACCRKYAKSGYETPVNRPVATAQMERLEAVGIGDGQRAQEQRMTKLKIDRLTPIPNASETSETVAKPGVAEHADRNRTSRQSESSQIVRIANGVQPAP
jgi:hypothetical protein